MQGMQNNFKGAMQSNFKQTMEFHVDIVLLGTICNRMELTFQQRNGGPNGYKT